jgi:hypothetical protein
MANGLFNLKQVIQAVQQGGWPAQKTPAVEYLVVAGGGGGGYISGGGGAGGLLQGLDPVPNGQTLLVTVGGGGAGGTGGASGASGQNSVFGSISARGGGAGGSYPSTSGESGGSGGGANSTSGSILGGIIGQGTAGQGNAGGLSWAGSQFQGGGGGGAGTVGLNAVPADTKNAGNGGAGISSAINGTVTAYAGGGGGASDSGSVSGNGGVGGGGAGGASRGSTGGTGTVNGGNGTANTGGGGGGYGIGGTGGTGGTGVVIVSYPDVYAAATTVNATASTSGSGSVVFSGTSQYLSTPSNNGFNFGTGDFTIECWFNSNNVGISQKGLIQTSATAGGLETGYTTGVSINFSGSGTNTIGANIGGSSYFSSPSAVTTGVWYHVAITRQSGTVNVWLNGVSVASGSGNTSNLSGTYCVVGGYYNTSYLYEGYLSNVRVIKGTALYTTTFTPSTAPLTAVTNTQLLLTTVSGSQFVDLSANSLTLTAVGTPTWNQLSPFATGSGYKNRVYTWTTSGTITF